MTSPIRNRTSPLAKFYKKVDGEFKGRVDAKGVERTSHTNTAAANKKAIADAKKQLQTMKSELQALKKSGAPAAELKAKRHELHQLQQGLSKDRLDAGYHSALSALNKWVGRE